MVRCYLCNAEINQLNKSKEHVIPNVFGGTITSDKLLCRKCNNGTAELEHKLAEQFIVFLSALDINRQRGQFPKTQIRTEKNDKLYLHNGFVVKEPITCKKINAHQIEYTVPNEATAKKILERLKLDYPDIDVEKVLSEAKYGEHYLEDKIIITYNVDNQCLAALCKIMVNYALYKNHSVGNIKNLVKFINEEKDCVHNSKGRSVSTICPVNTYSGNSPIIAPDAITCGIGVFGSKTLGKLYGFIQLFNFSKYCVVLDDEYTGGRVEDGFCFFNDNSAVVPNFSLGVFEENVGNVLDIEQLKKEMLYCLSKIQGKQVVKENERIASKTIETMIKKYPEKYYPYFPEEMLGDLSSEFAKRMVKFLIHIGAIRHE